MAQMSCPPSTRDVGEQYQLSAPTDIPGRDLHRPALSQTPSLCTCVRLTFVTAPTRRTMARDVPQFGLSSSRASLAEANSALFSCVKRRPSSRVLLRPGHSLKTDPRCGHSRLRVMLFGCCVLLLLLIHLPFVLVLSTASALCVYYDPLAYSARFLMFCMFCFVQLSVLNISFLK